MVQRSQGGKLASSPDGGQPEVVAEEVNVPFPGLVHFPNCKNGHEEAVKGGDGGPSLEGGDGLGELVGNGWEALGRRLVPADEVQNQSPRSGLIGAPACRFEGLEGLA